MVLSQIAFAVIITLTEYGCVLTFAGILRILVSSLLCSYAEAKLKGTDNIVLPFLAYILL